MKKLFGFLLNFAVISSFYLYGQSLKGMTEDKKLKEEIQEKTPVERAKEIEEMERTLEIPGSPAIKDTIKFLQGLGEEFKLPDDKVGYAREQIKKGNTYLDAIEAGRIGKIPTSTQETYLNSIIAISWALFDKAVTKGEGFTGGTIVTIDDNYKFYNFLLEYAKRFNSDLAQELTQIATNLKAGKKTKRAPKALKISKNCFAYSRESTHYPELQKREDYEGQFGIDIRYGKGPLMPLLPAQKQHLLFGKIKGLRKDLTFVKMENYGLCAGIDPILHTLQLFKKVAGKTKGYSRREDVPKDIKTTFNQLIEQVKKESKSKADEFSKRGANGIREIYGIARRLLKDRRYTQLAQSLINNIEAKYEQLELEFRRGNEVFIDIVQ